MLDFKIWVAKIRGYEGISVSKNLSPKKIRSLERRGYRVRYSYPLSSFLYDIHWGE